MARIAVLGGTVFLGGHAISRLLADGHEVRAIGRSPRGANLPAGIEIVPGDVTVPGTLPAQFAGVGRILRLTGLFAQPAYAAYPWEQATARGASLLLDGPVPAPVFQVGIVKETLARFVRGGRPVLLGRRPQPIRPIAADDDVMAAASRAFDLPSTADRTHDVTETAAWFLDVGAPRPPKGPRHDLARDLHRARPRLRRMRRVRLRRPGAPGHPHPRP